MDGPNLWEDFKSGKIKHIPLDLRGTEYMKNETPIIEMIPETRRGEPKQQYS